jgi:hypothetical protein
MWHPNGQLFISENCIYLLHLQLCFLTSCIIFEETPVYLDGRVCISIPHPPGEDPNGYELASERWTLVHTVWLRLLCLHTFSPFLFSVFHYEAIIILPNLLGFQDLDLCSMKRVLFSKAWKLCTSNRFGA